MDLRHQVVLTGILRKYLSKEAKVFVYGSRAKGTHQRFSDMDLAIEGELNSRDLGRLSFDLEDSNLPFQVDVHLIKDFSEDFLKLVEGDFVKLKLFT